MKMNGIFKIMVMLATFSLVSCSDEFRKCFPLLLMLTRG